MEWLTVSSLIAFGLILIVIEILFVPGTTVVGILGFLFEIGGVFLAFDYFGNSTGYMVLASAFILSIAVIILSFRSGVWNGFSLQDEHTSKVNEGGHDGLEVGQVGITISSLKPIGKALFNEKEYEVKTFGQFLYNNQKVSIVKLENNAIIVENIE